MSTRVRSPMPEQLIEAALAALDRGWAVFPCLPRSKRPATLNGLNDSSTDESLIRRWWTENPGYNPAINLGASGLTALDVDTGLADRESAKKLCDFFPHTLTVRTGRRPDWGIQLYYAGLSSNKPYELTLPGLNVSGEVRSSGYYVMAPGAVHDKSGATYAILRDVNPLPPVPPKIVELAARKIPKPVAGAPEKVKPSFRHYYLTARAVELFGAGLSGKGLVAALGWLNENRCDPPKRVPGELEGLADWVERNVTPGLWKEDTVLVAKLLADDPKWKSAWAGSLASFDGELATALEYLVQRLFASGRDIKPWQVERICKAAPLYRLVEGDGVL